ncbi:hypothetical protein [Ferrovibrio sp.]|uniref:hypothetical protein n=1 Tax=Ferrovibrio sp. TaxID=1917215 RepID=UPI0035AFA041
MRILLRLLAVMVIVIQLGGASCYKVADDGLVQQVPGYGYVVKFTRDYSPRQTGVSLADDPLPVTYDREKTYYAVFETEAAARRFIAEFPPAGRTDLPAGYVRYFRIDSPGGIAIEAKLKGGPDQAGRVLDRVLVPLPTGPQPQ